MSKIIKAFQINGEYNLKDVEISKIKAEKKKKGSKYSKKNNVQKHKINEEQKQKKLNYIEDKAEEIIEEAEQKAEKIIEKAEKEAEEIREKAHKDGFKRGYKQGKKEGLEDGFQKIEEYATTLENIIENTDQKLQDRKERLPAEVINLSINIAEKIVCTSLEIEPEIINDIVKTMINDIGIEVRNITVKMNPELFSYLKKTDLKKKYNSKKLIFQKDESLKRGDCVLETDFGGKNGTVENKIEILKEELLQGARENEIA